MNKKVLVFAIVLTAMVSTAKITAITIEVNPSLAPNAFGSPSFAAYSANALWAIENGLSSYGNPASPEFYSVVDGLLSPSQALVTSFPSWNGVANPTGGAFASELGNRLHFGLRAYGQEMSISQVSFSLLDGSLSGELSLPSVDFPTFGAEGTYTYSPLRIGIQYGLDGVKGGGDDVYITSGPNTQVVDELIFAPGSGNAWWPQPVGDETNQEAIDRVAAQLNAESPFALVGSYSIGQDTGTAWVFFGNGPNSVPDGGSTALLLGAGVIGLGLIRRKR